MHVWSHTLTHNADTNAFLSKYIYISVSHWQRSQIAFKSDIEGFVLR